MNISKFDRESICATCLSQDRKLFAVSDLHASLSVQHAKFYSEFSLTWTDKICWECQHTVRKMVAFKEKAQRAQAWLCSNTDSQLSGIECLSTLGISKGTALDITDIAPEPRKEPEPMVFITVKQELPEDTFDESMSSVEKDDVIRSFDNNDAKIKEEEIKKFVICVPTVEERKRKLPTPETEPAAGPDLKKMDLCTEETLTEEGLIKWRKKKRRMEFFALCIPLERCDRCIQPFDSPMSAKMHFRKHTDFYGDVECDICTQRMVEKDELEVHKKLHHRVLKCKRCPFEWDDMNTIRQHWSEMHGVKQTVWECEPCQRRFPNVRKLAAHVHSHRRRKCPECGKFVVEQQLKKHMMKAYGTVVAPRDCYNTSNFTNDKVRVRSCYCH